MPDQWDKMFAETGLATAHAPSQSQRDAMMLNAVVKLMRDDCDGKSGTTPTTDSILLDGISTCEAFRTDVEVTKVEGQPVFGGELALPKMMDACVSRHEVKFELRNGDTLNVQCKSPYQARAAFYGVNIEKVLGSLLRE